MRKSSPVERIRLLGRSGIDVVQALGRSSLFLLSSLFGRSGLSNGGQLLIRQLYFVGVLSLPIIEIRRMASGPLPISMAPLTGAPILPFSMR